MLYQPPRRGLWLPGGMPRINRAHPLAPALSSAIVFQRGMARDICGPLGSSTVLFGSATGENTRAGSATRLVNAGLQMAATISGPISLIFVAQRAATPTTGANFISTLASSINLGIAQTGVEIDMGNGYGDMNKLYMFSASAGAYALADGGWVDGVKQSGVNPCDITISNGQWYGIGTTFNDLVAGVGPLTFGSEISGSGKALDLSIALCLTFRGVLSDSAMADLTLDPGQVLLWPEDEVLAMMGHNGGPPLLPRRPFIFMH